MKKIIIAIILTMLIMPLILANNCYKYEPVKLTTGWNVISIITDYSDLSYKTINVTLINSSIGEYNIIGFSAFDKINLNKLKFYNSNNEVKTYQQALSSGWIEHIIYPNTPSTSGITDKYNFIQSYDGFWIKSYKATKISYTNVNGEPTGNTFSFNNLRFSNGTTELNIIQAGTEGWITTTFQYWGDNGLGDYDFVTLGIGDNLDSWKGYFVYSHRDNIYLLTNNETTKCKVTINPKSSKPIVKIQTKSENPIVKSITKINHEVRLYGGKRN